MNIERRTFDDKTMEFRAAEDDAPARISGHAAVFNSLSEIMWDFREQIAPGAFDKVLNDDVRALFNHDPSLILGRTSAGTARIGVDKTGLTYAVDIPDTTVGRDLIVSVERGDVSQSSFGFTIAPSGDDWEQDDDGMFIRTITNVARLFDVSPVSFPAYHATDVSKRSLQAAVDARLAAGQSRQDALIKAVRARQDMVEKLLVL
jgi:HK97 family phage prohead protease